MLEELGRLLTQAFLLNRQTAERWAELIIGNQTGEAARQLVLAYIRGRQVGYTVHGATLGMPKRIPTAVARRWREAGLRWVADVQSRVEKTFNERGDITRAFVRSYAEGVTTQATWAGQDQMFKELGAATSVEFKRWVRAWPRTKHRDHHDDLERAKAIPVDGLFTMPGGTYAGTQVYGPRDWERISDPSEWMNCGHALAFETAPTAENTEDPRGSVVYDPRNQPRNGARARAPQAPATPPPAVKAAPNFAAMTLEEAEDYARTSGLAETVNMREAGEEVTRTAVETLSRLGGEYRAGQLAGLVADASTPGYAAVTHSGTVPTFRWNPNTSVAKLAKDQRSGWMVGQAGREIESMVVHEFAHTLIGSTPVQYIKLHGQAAIDATAELASVRARYTRELTRLARARDAEGIARVKISDYSRTNLDEFIAEAFTQYKLDPNPSPYAAEVGEIIDRYFKR